MTGIARADGWRRRRAVRLAVALLAVLATLATGAVAASAEGGNLLYRGGPVQHDPTLYAVWWLPDGQHFEPLGNDATYESLMARFLGDFSRTNVQTVLSQYSDASGNIRGSSYGGSWTDTTPYPHAGTAADPLTDADVQDAVERAVEANPTWRTGTESQVIVFTAFGINGCNSAINQCTGPVHPDTVGYCGYHRAFRSSARGETVVYDDLPLAQSLTTVTTQGKILSCYPLGGGFPNEDIYADSEFSILSHEVSEAMTDPLPGTGTGAWTDASRDEIGDKCQGVAEPFGTQYYGNANVDVDGHRYDIQQEWSNIDGAGQCGGFPAPPGGFYGPMSGPYAAHAGASTPTIHFGTSAFVPSVGVLAAPDPTIAWGDGTSSTPSQPSGCVTCDLSGSHVYSTPAVYTATVTYHTGCCISYASSVNIIVLPNPVTITANDEAMPYGGAPPTFDATVSGIDPSAITGLTCGAVDDTGLPVSGSTPVGSYAITCSGAQAPNGYAITYRPGTLRVDPQPLTIAAGDQQATYGAVSFDPSAATLRITGLVPGDTRAVLGGALGVTSTATASSGAGDYPLVPGGASDENYVITYVNGTLHVAAAPLHVTAASLVHPYDGTVPAVAAGYAGLANGDAAPATPPTCGSNAPASGVPGVYATTCAGAVDPNYAIDFTPGTLSITQAPLTIAADAKAVQYSDRLPALTASATGLAPGGSLADLAGTLVCTTSVKTGTGGQVTSPAGSYPITCSGLSSGDYAITWVPGTLTVATEDVVVRPAAANPVYVDVARSGGAASSLTFTARVTEAADGHFGDIRRAAPVTFALVAVGAGGTSTCTVPSSRGAVVQVTPATATSPGSEIARCTFAAGTAAGVYDLHVAVGGSSYAGAADAALTVVDPSQAGLQSGGGLVTDPLTGNTGSFGFVAVPAAGGGVAGTVLYVEATATGTPVFVVRSTALSALTVARTKGRYPATATVDGSVTVNGTGGYALVLQATDRRGTANDGDALTLIAVPTILGLPNGPAFGPVALQTLGRDQIGDVRVR